jgi:death-on-curing protein
VTLTFLALDEVLAIHADQIDVYGGSPGLRDVGLLESALAMPQATFGGELLHPTLPEMAAAYLFHLASNHAFVDGNKRIALMATIVFLGMNGLKLEAGKVRLFDLVMGVANGSISKAAVAVFLAKHTSPRR